MISVDETVFLWINGLAGKIPTIDGIIRVLSCDIFTPAVMILALMAIWFGGRDQVRRERHQRAVFCALASMGFAHLIVAIFNAFYDHPRPFEAFPDQVNLIFYPPTDPSFPSNAAAAFFALAIGIFVFNRKLGMILLIPAIIVSFGRVYMGIHYPLDIIGGFLVAIVATSVALLVLKLAEPIPSWCLKLARKAYLA
jgi:undecaprenyl-diphosphatase